MSVSRDFYFFHLKFYSLGCISMVTHGLPILQIFWNKFFETISGTRFSKINLDQVF